MGMNSLQNVKAVPGTRCWNDECGQVGEEECFVSALKLWLWLFVLLLEIASVPEGSLSDWPHELSWQIT